MPAILLSLGSSLGVREEQLAEALARLEDAGVAIERISSLYETEPVGEAAGPGWFLNLAVAGRTDLEPRRVVALALAIEQAMGRTRAVRGGPRVIDIDLLTYDNVRLDDPACELPHPRMHERRFVLAPLAEIAPEARHPLTGATIVELLAACTDPSRVIERGPLMQRAAGAAGPRGAGARA